MYFGNDIIAANGAASAVAEAPVSKCATCEIRELAICSAMPSDALGELHRIGKRRMLHKGQALVWEGDEAPLIVNVLSGMLKLSSGARNGSEQILGLIGPGGFAGRPQGGRTGQTIAALIDTEICIFSSDRFAQLADLHPELRTSLLERSLGELDRTRRWMLLLGRGSAAERVAALLIDFTGEGAGPHLLPLSRGQMAEFAGLTIETVSRQLTRLKAAGVISLPSRDTFELLDREALLTIAGVFPEHGLH